MAVIVRCAAKSIQDRQIRKYFTYALSFQPFKGREVITACLRKDEKTLSIPLGDGMMIADEYNIMALNKGNCDIDVKFTATFRPYQLDIVTELDQKWTSDAKDGKCGPGLLAHLSPAWGKTILGAYAISKIKLRTLIVVPLLTLKKSWQKVLNEHTNATCVLVESKSDLEGIDVNNPPDVIVCMVTCISSIPQALKDRIGMMIIDEAHMCCTVIRIMEILSLDVYRVLVLSGTPDHPSGNTRFLDYLAPIRIVSPPPKYTVVGVHTGLKYEVKTKQMWNREKGSYSHVRDFNAYLHDIAADKVRLGMIRDIVLAVNERVMILARYQDHVKAITKTLQEAKISVDYMMGNKSTYKDSTVLIGTYAKMGVGMDQANICENFSGITTRILILVDTVKMTPGLFQYIGRVLRSDDPYVIQFLDRHSLCTDHWRENLKLYNEQEQKVEEVGYSQFIQAIKDIDTVEDVQNGTSGLA